MEAEIKKLQKDPKEYKKLYINVLTIGKLTFNDIGEMAIKKGLEAAFIKPSMCVDMMFASYGKRSDYESFKELLNEQKIEYSTRNPRGRSFNFCPKEMIKRQRSLISN